MKTFKKVLGIALTLYILLTLCGFSSSAETQSGAYLSSTITRSDAAWESAYAEIISQCSKEEQKHVDPDMPEPFSHYALTDINKDGIPELIVGLKHVSYSVSRVYTFNGGKVRQLGEIEDAHGFFAGVPAENGMLYCYEGQGYILVELWKMEGNGLTSRTVYDGDYFGDLPYPYPSEYYPGARKRPESLCDDPSALHLYELYSGPSQVGGNSGGYPNNDREFFIKLLKSPEQVIVRTLEKPNSEPDVISVCSRFEKGSAVRGNELLAVLGRGSGREEYHLSYNDVNGDGQLEAIIYPDGWNDTHWHSSGWDKLFPVVLSELNGRVCAYACFGADTINEDGSFLYYYNEIQHSWPFRLCFSYTDCCTYTLPEDNAPGHAVATAPHENAIVIKVYAGEG